MKNYKKYKKEIFNIAIKGDNCALDLNGKLVPCHEIACENCMLNGCPCCRKKFSEWCQQEYEESKIQEKVKHCKVDDKVMVSYDGIRWYKSYFMKYIPSENVVSVFYDGGTSWNSTMSRNFQYARLPREDEL